VVVGSSRKGAAGFTLVELLVVIAIIAVLAGMIISIVGMAQRRAQQTKAKSNITVVSVALEAYNTVNGIYPNGGVTGPAKDDPEALFRALYTGNPRIGGSRENHLDDWPPEQIGKWSGQFVDFYQNPMDQELDFTSGAPQRMVLLDPWGRAFHYVEFDSRAPSERTVQGGQLRGRTGQKFAVWSDGPNRTNDWGKEDDVTSWSEGKGGGR
jgi:prepilin-type N-terminal cleavage/methylation domain-containing protein